MHSFHHPHVTFAFPALCSSQEEAARVKAEAEAEAAEAAKAEEERFAMAKAEEEAKAVAVKAVEVKAAAKAAEAAAKAAEEAKAPKAAVTNAATAAGAVAAEEKVAAPAAPAQVVSDTGVGASSAKPSLPKRTPTKPVLLLPTDLEPASESAHATEKADVEPVAPALPVDKVEGSAPAGAAQGGAQATMETTPVKAPTVVSANETQAGDIAKTGATAEEAVASLAAPAAADEKVETAVTLTAEAIR